MKTILETLVTGRPAPKGSMDAMPGGYMKQNNAASTPWARTVADHCRNPIATRAGRPDNWIRKPGYPVDAPVVIWLEFRFRAPKRCMFDTPATIATGDIDKLTRNVLDALKSAGVYLDDARVTDAFTSARYVDDTQPEGVWIAVDMPDSPVKSVLKEVRTWWLDMMG